MTNVIAIMKLHSGGAVTVQHIPADSILREKDAQIAALKDALNDLVADAMDERKDMYMPPIVTWESINKARRAMGMMGDATPAEDAVK
jgi:hypothetical protein